MIEQYALFDYGNIDIDTTAELRQYAHEVRGLLTRTSEDIILIGRILLEAKARLPHKQFIPWVKTELGISQSTSWRFMQMAQGKQVKSFNMNDLVVLPPVEPIESNNGVRLNRRTKEDKRRDVETFFTDFPQLQALSNREIAKRCGVDETLVRTIRKELQPQEGQQETISAQQAIEEIVGVELPVEEGIEVTPPQVVESIPEPPKLPRIEASADVQMQRDIRRQEQQERNEQLRDKGVELPQNKYACIVIDPPWQMQKIDRDERPNQFDFDYPTMTEEELRNFQLPALASDDCHLYLWTTQKHLPLALRLAEHWGFKYQCLMTWVKNVGITPFSWMYSTEHVLFCTKGSLPLLEVGRRLDFSAKVREHSRKPDEFYEIVREVSPGPRIDVFSREKRDGFEQYGNEVAKYVSA